jgi:hypothetical protein
MSENETYYMETITMDGLGDPVDMTQAEQDDLVSAVTDRVISDMSDAGYVVEFEDVPTWRSTASESNYETSEIVGQAIRSAVTEWQRAYHEAHPDEPYYP